MGEPKIFRTGMSFALTLTLALESIENMRLTGAFWDNVLPDMREI